MITLVIAFCTSAALTDCTESQRLPMPPSMTMFQCHQVANVMMNDEAGDLVIPGEHKLVKCEKHKP